MITPWTVLFKQGLRQLGTMGLILFGKCGSRDFEYWPSPKHYWGVSVTMGFTSSVI